MMSQQVAPTLFLALLLTPGAAPRHISEPEFRRPSIASRAAFTGRQVERNGNSARMAVAAQACSEPIFSGPFAYVTGQGAGVADVGDVNGDNILDVAVTEEGNQVGVFLGNGDGTFTAPYHVSVDGTPTIVHLADVNGDGNLDLVTTNRNSNSLSILFGDGAGGFGAVRHLFISFPYDFKVADVNNDGYQDLVVGTNSGTSITIFIGDGTGGFGPPQTYSVGSNPSRLVVDDFNSDGALDVAASLGDGRVAVLLADGSGSFLPPSFIAVGVDPRVREVGDLDGDGNVDLGLTVSSGLDYRFSVLYGNGDGSFRAPVTIVPETMSAGFGTATDFNLDGARDLAVVTYANGSTTIRFGDGMGGFGTPTPFPVSDNMNHVVLGDFNGDGYPDFLVTSPADNTFFVYLNGCGSTP
jgi:hypothetical protein